MEDANQAHHAEYHHAKGGRRRLDSGAATTATMLPAILSEGKFYDFEVFFFPTGLDALMAASAALPCAFWAEAESSFLASLP